MFINIFKVTSPGVIEEFIDAINPDEENVLVRVDTMAICKADIRYFLGNRDINVLNHKYTLKSSVLLIDTIFKKNYQFSLLEEPLLRVA